MELRATLLGNHARNVRNARNARNARARARPRARDAATSARQLAAPRTQPRPTRNQPHALPAPRTLPAHTAHAHRKSPGLVPRGYELRPETWTLLMVAVMRLPVGSDPGILPGSGP